MLKVIPRNQKEKQYVTFLLIRHKDTLKPKMKRPLLAVLVRCNRFYADRHTSCSTAFPSFLLMQVYAPVSGENFNRDNVGYPASKVGNVYPPPFYMQGQCVQSGLPL